MVTRKVSPSTKTRAVNEVLHGQPISNVARKYGVNRTSLYRWLEISRGAIRLRLGTTAPAPSGQTEVRHLEKKIVALELKLERKNEQIKTLRKSARKKNEPDSRPQKCPECGCEKIYKSGTYHHPLSKIIPPEVYFEKKIPVKRFVCPSCRNSISLGFPDNLSYWLRTRRK